MFFFSEYDGAKLQEIIDTQERIVMHMKNKGSTKRLYNVAVILDD